MDYQNNDNQQNNQQNNLYQQPNNNYQQYNGYQQNNYQQYNGYQQGNNGYQQPNNGYQQPNRAPVKPKSIALYVILSILTCGIFSLYWLVVLAEDMNTISRDGESMSGAMVLLLSIVTCSIYLYIWSYKQGERIDRRKGTNNNTGIIYLLLSLFGFSIVTMALMQDEVNKAVA